MRRKGNGDVSARKLVRTSAPSYLSEICMLTFNEAEPRIK